MHCVKLVDRGITDKTACRASSSHVRCQARRMVRSKKGAVRVRRMLFLVMDAGRPPAGEWAKQQGGRSGVEVAGC